MNTEMKNDLKTIGLEILRNEELMKSLLVLTTPGYLTLDFFFGRAIVKSNIPKFWKFWGVDLVLADAAHNIMTCKEYANDLKRIQAEKEKQGEVIIEETNT